MNTQKTKTEETPAIYVGTYYKYNSGSLYGKWFNLTDYSDKSEFYEAISEYHKDEPDPEFMFQDYEYIPECFIGESWISEKFWDYMSLLDEIDNPEAFEKFVEWKGFDMVETDLDVIKDEFEDSYSGEWDSERDFAYDLIDSCYDLEKMMGSLRYYFDYESFTRDLFMSDYAFIDGHVFINC